MKAERLIELYDRISEAPDAVSRLRRFVLDLAVRGKLVEQDPEDEPASALLARISAEKEQLLANGKRRKASDNEPADESKQSFALPPGWICSRIEDLGVIGPRNDAPDDAIASFVPMPKIASEYGYPHQHEPRTWGEIKKGYTHFAEGDVGLAKITPCFENGKSTVFRNLTGGIGAGTTELHVLRPILVNPDYVLLFLKSPLFIETGIPNMTGTAGQKRVPREYFANTPFPLPPLAEQHRIVARVDELMALCDRLEEQHGTSEVTRDRLTTATLSRLTASDTDEQSFRNHAHFALDTLPALTARADQIKALRQTIVDLAASGALAQQQEEASVAPLETGYIEPNKALPPNWRYVRLAGLLRENTRNGYSRRPDNAIDGVPLLRISAGTSREDGLVAEEEHKLISGIDASTRDQYALEAGDLLACRFNGNKAFVGRLTLFADYLGIKPIYPDKLIRVRLNPEFAFPEFIRIAGDSDVVRREMERFCATTVGNWGISAGNLKQVAFPVPPLTEQRRIVAKVDELMALCDRLEASLQQADEKRARLLEALLAEALAPAEEAREAA